MSLLKSDDFLADVERQSGGEHARTPDASRVSQTPGSREAFGVRVALAPLGGTALCRDAATRRGSGVARKLSGLVPGGPGGFFNATRLAEIR